LEHSRSTLVNRFETAPKLKTDFAVRHPGGPAHVIVAEDRSILTGRIMEQPAREDGYAVADPGRDILKLAVINRYRDTAPAVAFIRGFGLQRGAMASSVAHDSHNIVAVGVSDKDLCAAVNLVIANRGGLAVASGTLCEILPLPVAGLISPEDGYTVAARYAHLKALAQGLGTTMHDPFVTLSFMALLVIPRLKLSDKGLFDVERFALIDGFA
ncbi:MAG: adenine deaminase C-terminal domain-containing protein, partial [Syntrophaceae bacterium]